MIHHVQNECAFSRNFVLVCNRPFNVFLWLCPQAPVESRDNDFYFLKWTNFFCWVFIEKIRSLNSFTNYFSCLVILLSVHNSDVGWRTYWIEGLNRKSWLVTNRFQKWTNWKTDLLKDIIRYILNIRIMVIRVIQIQLSTTTFEAWNWTFFLRIEMTEVLGVRATDVD